MSGLLYFLPLPKEPIAFLSLRKFAYILSALMIIGSVGLLATKGLNFGIDFEGGILIEVVTPEDPDLSAMRQQIGALDLGDYALQEFGAANDILIRIQNQPGGEAEQQAAIEKVRNIMPEGTEYRRVEYVGPTIGAELIRAGITAVVLAIVAILIYIWFRFEWQFGIGAIIALMHDVILTLGFFSLLQMDFNLSTIAAILTIAGYSINDTVIVYDRIREKMRKYKKMEMPELINFALTRTLSRTLLTSVTTLLALFSLYFLGGEVIAGFSLAMIWGIVIGTYSSIFIAAPVLLLSNLRSEAVQVGAVESDAP